MNAMSAIVFRLGRARPLLCTLALMAASCAAPRPPLVVSDPDPSVKIPAIQKAVREKDQSAVPQLIKDLDSDDAAVRMYANHALEELTGQNFGFRYYDDDAQREPAVQRWKRWLSETQEAKRGKSSGSGTGGGPEEGGGGGASAVTRASHEPS
jgi:hypothetical protein